jgi:superfamily II DNA or RNA helicase
LKKEKTKMNNTSIDRILTAHGYAIKKSSLTPRSTQKLRKDLTVAPLTKGKARGPDTSFTVYMESPTKFYVPRCWATDTYGPAQEIKISEGQALSARSKEFTGNPYPYQEAIIQNFLDSGSNGLICVPCGKGKTFMALAIASRIARRFMVVVDKEFLMNQWRGEMAAVMPNLRVGILQGDKLEVEPSSYDVTICMIQTLCMREFPEKTFESYGFTIFDECHHLGAAHFSRALMKIQTKNMLGLSATPIRDDGLTKVFEWFLGKPVYWEKTREPDPTVVVRKESFKCDDPKYNEIPVDYRGEMITARLLTHVVECEERNRLIVKLLKEVCQDPHRRILVLSERIGHLNRIEELMADSGHTMAYYVGGMKEEKRESEAATAKILLASYSMASEAMNIKVLNTVILATPRKKVEQSTGRILRVRVSERQVSPLIVDIVDSHGMYQGQWRQRRAYYNKCAYKIQSSENESETHEKLDLETCLLSDD